MNSNYDFQLNGYMRKWIFAIILIMSMGIAVLPEQSIHPPFKKIWEFDAGEYIENYIPANDFICFSTWKTYGVLDYQTGKLLWRKSRSCKSKGRKNMRKKRSQFNIGRKQI